jgi:hypothetical protein
LATRTCVAGRSRFSASGTRRPSWRCSSYTWTTDALGRVSRSRLARMPRWHSA